MIKFSALALLLALPHTCQTNKEATMGVQDRIRLLKLKINEQLKHVKTTDAVSLLPGENYDYEDEGNKPITPVMKDDDNPIDNRYKMPKLKTKKTTLEYGFDRLTTPHTFQTFEIRNIGRAKKQKHLFEKPVETFYRKVFRRQLDDEAKNTPLAWLHCQDVITPYLTGAKEEIGVPYMVDYNHTIVTRLIQIFTTNTTLYDRTEISDIVHQIAEIEIRLYQWTPEALKRVFEVLMKGHRHSFSRLVYSLRKLFREWHLDYHNVTNLLQQTRIFRPVCIYDTGDQSSTKTSGGTRYTTPISVGGTSTGSDNEDCNDRK